jgi:hypothetical protein
MYTQPATIPMTTAAHDSTTAQPDVIATKPHKLWFRGLTEFIKELVVFGLTFATCVFEDTYHPFIAITRLSSNSPM